MLKKIFVGIGILVGLFVLAAILIPLVVDVNKYRPQIEKLVDENINGELEVGKLALSLWGGVTVEIDKLVLSEKGSQGKRPIFSMNNAKLEIPLASLLSGKPDITLAVKRPEIQIVSGLDGKLNASKLAKPPTPEQAAAQKAQAARGAPAKSGGAALPFQLSFRIQDGHVVYADQKKNTRTDIKGLDFDLNHFALNQPFRFALKSDLNVKEMKDLELHGPLKLEGTAGIYMDNSGGLDHLDLDADADLSELVIRYSTLFNKTSGVPLKIATKLAASEKNLKIAKGHLQINDAAVDVTGTIIDFANPVVDMDIASTKFVFEHWQKVLAPLKDFDMQGEATFGIKINGPVSKLAFKGKAGASGISLRAPGIVPRITEVRAQLSFSNDTAAVSDAFVKIGSSDLALNGSVKNFAKPVIALNVKGGLLDVDAILPQKTPEQAKAEEQAAAKAETSQGQKGADADMGQAVSGPIAAMKKNPTARGLDFTGRVQIGKIRVNKAELTDLNAEMTFKDLVMALKKASAKAFGGSLGFNSSIDFRGADPSYQVGGEVNGVDVNAAISNQMPSLKDSVFGRIMSKFSINGSGVSKARVKQTLKGNGNFRLADGTWSALKVMQQVGEKLKSIPQAKDKLGNVNITGKFRQLKADFNIAGGRLNIVNMVADMEEANTGLNGNGYVDFDLNMDINGKILAPAGGDLPGELRASDGRLSLPYEIACQAKSPCLKMDGAAQTVAKAYLKKEGGAAIKKALEKIDNPSVQDVLKKLPF